MPRQTNTRMLVVVSDLFFTVKILDAAKHARMQPTIVKTPEALVEEMKNTPALVIFDLNFEAMNPVKAIAQLKKDPQLRGMGVISFVSHIQADLKKEAQDAGSDMVLARSAFAQNLPHILKRYSGVI